MKKYLELIRIKQWIKNILIFIPMFTSTLINCNNIWKVSLGFFSFCFASSFIYILNDIRDIEKDKLHPRKKKRPLPSGLISKKCAIIISIIMLLLSLGLNFYINNTNLIPYIFILSYIVINILYSMGLKDIVILDIVILASGFVLRIFYGASIIDIEVSNWLFLTIMSASMFLGLGKRKKEIIHNSNSRKVLAAYNEAFLDKLQYNFLTLTIVFYSLWTIEQLNNMLVYTIPFIIIIFMRYSLIIERENEGDPSTLIYKDKPLLIICLLYSICMGLLLLVV